jgi:hypothetical protein
MRLPLLFHMQSPCRRARERGARHHPALINLPNLGCHSFGNVAALRRWIRCDGDAIDQVASVPVEQDHGSGSAQFGADGKQLGSEPFSGVGGKLQVAEQHAVLVQNRLRSDQIKIESGHRTYLGASDGARSRRAGRVRSYFGVRNSPLVHSWTIVDAQNSLSPAAALGVDEAMQSDTSTR